MTIYLHIGLHKTATSFFQREVFTRLDQNKIVYNPPELYLLVHKIFACNFDNEYDKLQFNTLIEKEEKDILISLEHLSQRPLQQNYSERSDLVKKIFPKAKIILFLRFQPDWILSAYNQTIKSHDYQDIKQFLCFSNNEFGRPDELIDKYNLRKMDIHKSNFAILLRSFIENFGKENIHVFFFEDFNSNQKKITEEVCNVIGATVDHSMINYDKFVNRAFSALSYKILVYYGSYLKLIGYKNPGFVERMRREHKNISRRNEDPNYDVLWDDAKQQKSFHALIPIFLKKVFNHLRNKTLLSRFLERFLDRIVYIDWDLLAKDGMRKKMEKYFRKKNEELLKYIPRKKIPKIYLEPGKD